MLGDTVYMPDGTSYDINPGDTVYNPDGTSFTDDAAFWSGNDISSASNPIPATNNGTSILSSLGAGLTSLFKPTVSVTPGGVPITAATAQQQSMEKMLLLAGGAFLVFALLRKG